MLPAPSAARRAVVRASTLALLGALGTTACTGLVAGPETSAVAPVSVSRDSAWVRARRAAQAEAFTLDLTDSLNGRIVGTRYPASKAQLGSSAACRVRLALQIQGDRNQAQVATNSRWLAPEQMEDKAPKVCEQERVEVLTRVAQTIAPPAQ